MYTTATVALVGCGNNLLTVKTNFTNFRPSIMSNSSVKLTLQTSDEDSKKSVDSSSRLTTTHGLFHVPPQIVHRAEINIWGTEEKPEPRPDIPAAKGSTDVGATAGSVNPIEQTRDSAAGRGGIFGYFQSDPKASKAESYQSIGSASTMVSHSTHSHRFKQIFYAIIVLVAIVAVIAIVATTLTK